MNSKIKFTNPTSDLRLTLAEAYEAGNGTLALRTFTHQRVKELVDAQLKQVKTDRRNAYKESNAAYEGLKSIFGNTSNPEVRKAIQALAAYAKGIDKRLQDRVEKNHPDIYLSTKLEQDLIRRLRMRLGTESSENLLTLERVEALNKRLYIANKNRLISTNYIVNALKTERMEVTEAYRKAIYEIEARIKEYNSVYTKYAMERMRRWYAKKYQFYNIGSLNLFLEAVDEFAKIRKEWKEWEKFADDEKKRGYELRKYQSNQRTNSYTNNYKRNDGKKKIV